MGELYERLLDEHPNRSPHPDHKDKIYTDGLQAAMRLFQAGLMTVNQIDAYFAANMGAALGTQTTGSNAGRQEVQDLFAVIPTGSTTASRLDRIEFLARLEAVLVMVDTKTAPFDTPAAIRSVLGVPNRS